MIRETDAAIEMLPGLDPRYLAAKKRLMAGKGPRKAIPRRQYGRTRRKLSSPPNPAPRIRTLFTAPPSVATV